MDKIHNLEINKDSNIYTMFAKLGEEYTELVEAIVKQDDINLVEELLDIIQCCYGIAFTKGIKLEEHIKDHNEKLLSRNHKFID